MWIPPPDGSLEPLQRRSDRCRAGIRSPIASSGSRKTRRIRHTIRSRRCKAGAAGQHHSPSDRSFRKRVGVSGRCSKKSRILSYLVDSVSRAATMARASREPQTSAHSPHPLHRSRSIEIPNNPPPIAALDYRVVVLLCEPELRTDLVRNVVECFRLHHTRHHGRVRT